MAYDDIPDEIKRYDQWINWIYETVTDDDGKQRIVKIPVRPLDGRKANVNNPLDWVSFYQAKNMAEKMSCGLGFVFTKSDPFTGIDLDNKDRNDVLQQHLQSIASKLNSYSEVSPSGLGLHIIVKAVLPGKGRRRDNVEIYDNQRFFTFTGNVVNNVPIMDRQIETLEIYNSIGVVVTEVKHNGYELEHLKDFEIVTHASNAINGDKFKRLWEGDWQTDYGRQSQSEADFALINIIAFYSRNATQTARVFRQSKLGLRPKANRGDYVTSMVRRSFDRMPATISMPLSGSWFDATTIEPWNPKLTIAKLGPIISADWKAEPIVHTKIDTNLVRESVGDFDFVDPVAPMIIPGLVGDLINYCWNAAIHQIAEAAVCSALSTMSLLCSRSYRNGSMGLSLYLMLLAQTSTGKSFAYQANDAIFNAMATRYRSLPPPASQHGKLRAEMLDNMVMGEMASAQGLADQMVKSPSTLAQLDEYVDHIRLMANPNPPAFLAQIRSELLKLVEHSGPGRIYRARKYSKRSASIHGENVDVISASLSILATGTPEQFYDELSPTLLTSGFLPRFTILEYNGGLTKRNKRPVREIDTNLLNNLCFVFDKAINLSTTLTGDPNEFIDVQPRSLEAIEYLEWFDNVCYAEVAASNRMRTNMAGIWSRAKEHVRQIASLIAIGVNPHVPIIEAQHVGIAIAIVRPSVDKIQRKVIGGDIGTGDDRREAEIKEFVVRLIEGGWTKYSGSGFKRELFENGYFQLAIIRNYCVKLASFKNHRMGASRAFEDALMSLVKYGVLKIVTVANSDMKCVQLCVE